MIFEHPIYPITTDSQDERTLISEIERFVSSGVSLAQIRSKQLSSEALLRVVEEAMEIAQTTGTKIIVNDRVDIALASGADGVHLGQTDLPPGVARDLLGNAKLIGFSTHNPEQFEEALSFPIDYIALGPVFTTSSKENPDPVVGIEVLERCVELSDCLPVVAIGGINDSNLSEISRVSADAAAVISAATSRPDALIQLRTTWDAV